jgi:hypothetical protein
VILEFSEALYTPSICQLPCSISLSHSQIIFGYHGIASSFFTCNYISFIVLNHLFFTVSKYFPKFCVCSICYFQYFPVSHLFIHV